MLTDTDLSLVTSEDLYKELSNRCHNCVFIFSMDAKMKGQVINDYWSKASYSELLGLIKFVDLRVTKRVIAD